jgi:hypothetical protein
MDKRLSALAKNFSGSTNKPTSSGILRQQFLARPVPYLGYLDEVLINR